MLVPEYRGRELKIDGKRFKNFEEGWLPKKPEKIFEVANRSRVIAYGTLSPEKYAAQKAKLEEQRTSAPGSDYTTWKSIEDEFAWRKFLDQHPARTEQYEEFLPVEIVEYDITGNTSNPYIIPMRFCGSENDIKDEKILYRYMPNPYEFAKLVGIEFNLEEVEDKTFLENTKGRKWSLSKSDTQFKYLKINGNYCSGDGFYLRQVSAGTWNECTAAHEENMNRIRGFFEKAVNLLNAEGKKYDKKLVIDRLETIRRRVLKIDSKARSEERPSQIANFILQIIKEL